MCLLILRPSLHLQREGRHQGPDGRGWNRHYCKYTVPTFHIPLGQICLHKSLCHCCCCVVMLFSAWGGRRVGCQIYLEVRLLWVQILALQFSSCVIWGRLLYLSVPVFSSVKWEGNTHFMGIKSHGPCKEQHLEIASHEYGENQQETCGIT